MEWSLLCWIGSIKKHLSGVETAKTQVHHRKGLRSFTPTEPIPETKTTTGEWKLVPEVAIKHGDLYARAWESEYVRVLFDSNQVEPDLLISHGTTLQSDLIDDETCANPSITPEGCRLNFLKETGYIVEQIRFWILSLTRIRTRSFINLFTQNWYHRGTKYTLCHNPKPECTSG